MLLIRKVVEIVWLVWDQVIKLFKIQIGWRNRHLDQNNFKIRNFYSFLFFFGCFCYGIIGICLFTFELTLYITDEKSFWGLIIFYSMPIVFFGISCFYLMFRFFLNRILDTCLMWCCFLIISSFFVFTFYFMYTLIWCCVGHPEISCILNWHDILILKRMCWTHNSLVHVLQNMGQEFGIFFDDKIQKFILDNCSTADEVKQMVCKYDEVRRNPTSSLFNDIFNYFYSDKFPFEKEKIRNDLFCGLYTWCIFFMVYGVGFGCAYYLYLIDKPH